MGEVKSCPTSAVPLTLVANLWDAQVDSGCMIVSTVPTVNTTCLTREISEKAVPVLGRRRLTLFVADSLW